MMDKLFLRILILIAGLLSFMTLVWPLQAQTHILPKRRDVLIQSIQMRAQRDLEMSKQPKVVGDLQVLFGSDASAVGMPMTEVTDIYETAYQTAKDSRPWWKDLPSPGLAGGLMALGALLALVFHKVVEEYLTRFFKWLFEAVYKKLAGYSLFWMFALRRYRKALERSHQELKIPFRPERPLKMQDVYVPLRVAGNASHEAVDAYQEIQKHKWLVVVGAPGAGKSMLLRHLTLTYARRGLSDFPHQPVPMLLELNRLNDPGVSLLEYLTRLLELNDFPNASRFIKTYLKHGQLLLLFDGLDEVGSQARERVVNQIKDLLTEYHDTRTIITCRTQVYRNEFAEQAERKLEIVEFSDQQIQLFLSAWEPDMPEGKSVDHFLRTLRERPQIMVLARNPLLLTIIAYLYTDTAFVLPHSRAEFYDRSTTLLLDQWKVERNRYKASQKHLVLQSLAFFNHIGQAGRDRRSIEFPAMLAQIRSVLPSLTLKDDDAQPMLDEIVERSGLLLTVDGGIRYQFTHLTLQEFFAAQALEARPNDLMAHFTADSDAWREVVRLWCGLEHDSTGLIRRIYTLDRILAFECLGDAQQVEPAYVDKLIGVFKDRLAKAAENENLARAMALVAADPRQRGIALFNFLKDNLARPRSRLAAATALSLTNLPKAADALAERACDDADLRPHLTRMGDLAVPALASWANRRKDWAFDALCEIGTPSAALALAPLLWDDDKIAPHRVAWRLAALLHQQNVEAALRSFNLTPYQRKAGQIEWIWEPFNEPPGSALPVIAGRTAYLLHTAPTETIPPGPPPALDPRLMIPLCAIVSQGGQLTKLDDDARKKLVEALKKLAPSQVVESAVQTVLGQAGQNDFVAGHVDQVSTHPTWRHLFHSLPSASQFNLLRCLIQNKPTPARDDWHNIFRPVKYAFDTSLQVRGVKLLLILVFLLNTVGAVYQIVHRTKNWSWGNSLGGLWGFVMLITIWVLGRAKLKTKELCGSIFYVVLVIGPVIGAVIGAFTGNWVLGAAISTGFGAIGGIVSGVVISDFFQAAVFGAIVGVFGAIIGAIGGAIGSPIIGAIGGIVGGIVVGAIGGSISGIVSGIVVGMVVGAISCAIIGAILALLVYIPTILLLIVTWNWLGAVLFWLIWLVCLGVLLWYGRRQERRAQNPLHGLLGEQGLATAERAFHLLPFMHWLPWYRD